MDPSAQFLRPFEAGLQNEDPEHNKLSIVVYATTGAGLLKEAAVLCGIQEGRI
jgi:hypothetical protein